MKEWTPFSSSSLFSTSTNWKKCSSSTSCNHCKGPHIGIMHNFDRKHERHQQGKSNMCTKVFGENSASKNCRKIVLVDVTREGSCKSLRCYAIIDEQSTSTFADPKIASFFEVSGPISDYSLKTLSNSSSQTQGIVLKAWLWRALVREKPSNCPQYLPIPSSLTAKLKLHQIK